MMFLLPFKNAENPDAQKREGPPGEVGLLGCETPSPSSEPRQRDGRVPAGPGLRPLEDVRLADLLPWFGCPRRVWAPLTPENSLWLWG